MPAGLRLCFVSLYAVGPLIALAALRQRDRLAPAAESRITGWRGLVPTVLLPFEWLLPPVLILFGLGELGDGGPSLSSAGLALCLVGTVLMIWAAATLGRFLIHAAAIVPDHALVTRGPYRFVRHPIYSGYLALLLGSGVGTSNLVLLLFWPISLLGILIQSGAEEELLKAKFGEAYRDYAARTGRLLPHFRGPLAP
jgi:protein-S-isoprenylcysteine O-methyltransferase Ste14